MKPDFGDQLKPGIVPSPADLYRLANAAEVSGPGGWVVQPSGRSMMPEISNRTGPFYPVVLHGGVGVSDRIYIGGTEQMYEISDTDLRDSLPQPSVNLPGLIEFEGIVQWYTTAQYIDVSTLSSHIKADEDNYFLITLKVKRSGTSLTFEAGATKNTLLSTTFNYFLYDADWYFHFPVGWVNIHQVTENSTTVYRVVEILWGNQSLELRHTGDQNVYFAVPSVYYGNYFTGDIYKSFYGPGGSSDQVLLESGATVYIVNAPSTFTWPPGDTYAYMVKKIYGHYETVGTFFA